MKKTLSLLAVAAFALFTLNSCSKDDENSPSGTYKVQYKLIGSDGVKISTIAFNTDGLAQSKTITNLDKQTFESEVYTITNEGYPTMSSGGTGPSDNSTLKAQIFKNGELWKESVATGKTLVVSVSGVGN